MDKTKLNVLVLVGHGINCDRELEAAFRKGGANTERVHLNDLVTSPDLNKYHIVAIPVR
jgi:phosphoribosylformylglycinamidine (FGAM) synthase-like amidotransferase family enzyme